MLQTKQVRIVCSNGLNGEAIIGMDYVKTPLFTPTKPFGVVLIGGSIGEAANSVHPYLPRFNGRLVAEFDDREEAKTYAKERRSRLSKGERSHYGMSYKTVVLKK
jgi:hypothetical protein